MDFNNFTRHNVFYGQIVDQRGEIIFLRPRGNRGQSWDN